MKITAYPQPSILHEAVELVHAYVNQTPLEQLTGQGPWSIPGDEVERILSTACEGLDPQEEEMQFFFRGVPFEDKKDGLFSIARNLVYAWAGEIHSDPYKTAECLLDYWQKYHGTLRVKGVYLYGVSVCHDPSGAFHNLTSEISKLPLPPVYQLQLVETMSCYPFYFGRLLELLKPVLEKLPALLLPLVSRAVPLLGQWEQFFSQEENFREFFLKMAAVETELPQELHLYLRYFQPRTGWICFEERPEALHIHLGIGQEKSILRPEQSAPMLESCDHLVLRQLAGADRMSMLMVMMDTPMTAQEVARKLELHPSSVFRDLNAMSNSRLLIKDVSGGKSTYRTNYPMLQELFRRILRTLDDTRQTSL